MCYKEQGAFATYSDPQHDKWISIILVDHYQEALSLQRVREVGRRPSEFMTFTLAVHPWTSGNFGL